MRKLYEYTCEQITAVCAGVVFGIWHVYHKHLPEFTGSGWHGRHVCVTPKNIMTATEYDVGPWQFGGEARYELDKLPAEVLEPILDAYYNSPPNPVLRTSRLDLIDE